MRTVTLPRRGRNGVRRGLGASSAALGAALVLAACVSAPEPTPQPTASESEDAPASPDSSRDEASREESAAGAESFARYAMEVYSELYLTGNADAWATLYAPECEFCTSATTQAVEFWGSGGELTVQDPPFITINALDVIDPFVPTGEWIVQLEVTENDTVWRQSDGSETLHTGEVHPEWTLTMVFQDNDWVLLDSDPGGHE